MKLALTGAHGTGKTTLVGALKVELEKAFKVVVCGEAARAIIAEADDLTFFQRGNNTPLRQSLIYIKYLIEEERQAALGDVMIADRTMVDHLAYSMVLFPEFRDTTELRVLKRLCFESLSNYQRIFKTQIEFPVASDGVREGDPMFQRQIDQMLDELYQEANVLPIALRGSVNDRLRLIMARI